MVARHVIRRDAHDEQPAALRQEGQQTSVIIGPVSQPDDGAFRQWNRLTGANMRALASLASIGKFRRGADFQEQDFTIGCAHGQPRSIAASGRHRRDLAARYLCRHLQRDGLARCQIEELNGS
jgi:hypothetical protein